MKPTKFLFQCAPVALALGAGLILTPAGRAQSALQVSDNRFLFIFNTSADMKKRLPAVKTEMDQLLATSLGGQLRSGNSIGVWTFDQNLRAGQFPLQHWRAEDAAAIAAGINKFVGGQHYANHTRFDALQPSLNDVIQNSVRLTVLIFCDGDDKINWTPYAAGINQAFQQRVAEQKRAKQPFVLVLRTQLGNYVGCTMNFPPGMVSLPDFPPLPPPPPPVKPAPPPQAKPPPTGPPLVIVGTNIFTNWPPPAPPPAVHPVLAAPTNVAPATLTNPVASANPPPPPLPANPAPATPAGAVPSVQTNSVATEVPMPPTNPAPEVQTNVAPPPANPVVPAASGSSILTNSASVPSTKPAAAAATNAVTPPGNAAANHQGMLVMGGVLLAIAGVLALLAWIRSRRANHGSLITRSMRKD